MRRFAFWTLAGLCLTLAGCGGGAPSSGIRLALDGPELTLAGELGDRVYEGHMDRNCMAGVGNIALYDPTSRTVCRGTMDAPASQKGRLYAELSCTDGRKLHVALRNLGPDQGLGVGRFEGETRRLTLFYHACATEARRRLQEVRREMDGLEPALKEEAKTAVKTPAPAPRAPQKTASVPSSAPERGPLGPRVITP